MDPASSEKATKNRPERHGQAWSAEEEKALYDAFTSGKTIRDCVDFHQRSSGGIHSCLKRLGLVDEEGRRISPPPSFSPTQASQKRGLQNGSLQKNKSVKKAPKESRSSIKLNEQSLEVLRLMEETNTPLFITGRAGTGKSTLLSKFCEKTSKNPVVLAPTGVAAINVKGQTIHRFFNFYADVTPEMVRRKKFKPRDTNLFKKLKTIIIDEISMVRADLLDCVDLFLRLYGPHASRPFGGVQMIFVGDLYQLPPVVKEQEKEIFAEHYKTPFFFSAHALKKTRLDIIELDTVYRQKEPEFVELLNRIRNNSATAHDIACMNGRVEKTPNLAVDPFSITLTARNATANSINDSHLEALKGELLRAEARIEGQVDKDYYPAQTDLSFKIGAQIMMLNNDSDRRWYNGSIGIIKDMKTDEKGLDYIEVQLQDSRAVVKVYRHTWEIFRFTLENEAIVSELVGTFTQYPFRLAWAITIHKSQGKTFNSVVIDLGRGAFAPGQVYVALSRCTSLKGITLKKPLWIHDVLTDDRILSFFNSYHYRRAGRALLNKKH